MWVKRVLTIAGIFVAMLFMLLFPIQKAVAADDDIPPDSGIPDSALKAPDYFFKSMAKPEYNQNRSSFSTTYPQALIVTGSANYQNWQIGGMWSKQRIDLNSAFTYETAHYFGSRPGYDADGMTFTLQNDPEGIAAYGAPGGGLGAYPWSRSGPPKQELISHYIQNALSIEMDSYWSGDRAQFDDMYDYDYPNTKMTGHLGVVRPGETPLTTKTSRDVGHLQYVPLTDATKLSNGKFRPFTVKWTPSVTYKDGVRILGGDLQYYMDGNPKEGGIFRINNVLDYFKSDKVLFGYTGSSGTHPTFQAVALLKMPQNAQPVTVNFVDTAGNAIQDPLTIPGDPGNQWDAAKRRPEWIHKGDDWYQYTGKYTANTPDQKDAGTFSAIVPYTVTYQYEARRPPLSYVLKKAVRNDTAGETDFKTSTDAKDGDLVTYELTYTNLLGGTTGSIKDQLDANHTYQNGSLQIANADTGGAFKPYTAAEENFKTNHTIPFPYTIKDGDSFKVRFTAKIARQDTAETILNQASVGGSGSDQITSNQTTIHLPATTGKVTFRYVNRASDMAKPEVIAPEVTVTGKIGQKVSDVDASAIRPKAIKDWTVIDQASNADLTQATFDQAEVVDPVFNKEETVITYRYEKPMLKLTVDPSLDFGDFDTNSVDRTYYIGENQAKTKQKLPFGVTIEDYYGVSQWQLSVQQNGQFTSEVKPDSQNPDLHVSHTLDNATLHFLNPRLQHTMVSGPAWAQQDNLIYKAPDDFALDPTATKSTVLAAIDKRGHYLKDDAEQAEATGTLYDNSGASTWRLNFGDADSAPTSVGLHVPASTKRYQAHYKTTLTWNLSMLP